MALRRSSGQPSQADRTATPGSSAETGAHVRHPPRDPRQGRSCHTPEGAGISPIWANGVLPLPAQRYLATHANMPLHNRTTFANMAHNISNRRTTSAPRSRRRPSPATSSRAAAAASSPSPRAPPTLPRPPSARGEGWGEGRSSAPTAFVEPRRPRPRPSSALRQAQGGVAVVGGSARHLSAAPRSAITAPTRTW